MVIGVRTEGDCAEAGCHRIGYVCFEFDLNVEDAPLRRWYCFDHAIELFDLWENYDTLNVVELPDESFFNCSGYPSQLSILATVAQHGQ